MGVSRYELLTRPGCHLCDEMEEVLDQVFSRHGLVYERVDVDGDQELKDRYGEVIPVLLRDGRAVAKIRLEPDRLERIVRRRR